MRILGRTNLEIIEDLVQTIKQNPKTLIDNSWIIIFIMNFYFQKTFKCISDGCDQSYICSSHLNRHIKTIHKKKEVSERVPCREPTCKSMFTNTSNMNRHFKQAHVIKKPYECSDCHEKFSRKLQLKQHEFQHTGQYPYKCKDCDKGYCSQRAFLKHQTVHKELQKLHKCLDCSLQFQKWSEFMAHRKIAHADRFECDLCHMKFFSKQNLKHHFKIHRPKDDRTVYQCHYENCPKFYFENRNLTAHIRSKHKGKKFVCDIDGCKRALSTNQKLKQHMKLHRSSSPVIKKPSIFKKIRAKRKDAGLKRLEIQKLLNINLEPEIQEIVREGKGQELQIQVQLPIDSDTDESIVEFKSSNFICVNEKL